MVMRIRKGDVVLVSDVHHFSPHFYEVSSVEKDCVVSQPCDYRHWLHDVQAVFRFDGVNLVKVWPSSV